ncbi:hypothetical protein ONE63_008519 [Megalurothrips usitatus]|uniref:Thioredoxin domain-containing protein 9 n=1 Tax=Megalurothrips usitatus TaxID=439358 RepID=A0AAV7XQK0_9NEOP|nr:hypothetical protein ONE63_008519 [Megalurothrips usitatus]
MATGTAGIENLIKSQVMEVARNVEQHLDSELEKLENMDADDMERLRGDRLKQLKDQARKRQEWLTMGHGEYTEIHEEKEFFEISKKSKDIVCHFYKDGSPRCKIVDHHLKLLCKKHVEARFVRLNVEKAPFLTERLRVRIIPTIALIKDSKTKDFIVGFTDLGNCDDFSTEMLEWRIATAGVIEYSGDLLNPPEKKKKPKTLLGAPKRSIRGRDSDSDIDDEEEM